MACLEFVFKYSGAKPNVYMSMVCILGWAGREARGKQSIASNVLIIIEAGWWVLTVLPTFVCI